MGVLTQAEARDRLRKQFPGRAVCVAVEEWYHAATDTSAGHEQTSCRVSLLPGLAGEKCSLWFGETVDNAVAACLTDRSCTALPVEKPHGCGLCAQCKQKEAEEFARLGDTAELPALAPA